MNSLSWVPLLLQGPVFPVLQTHSWGVTGLKRRLSPFISCNKLIQLAKAQLQQHQQGEKVSVRALLEFCSAVDAHFLVCSLSAGKRAVKAERALWEEMIPAQGNVLSLPPSCPRALHQPNVLISLLCLWNEKDTFHSFWTQKTNVCCLCFSSGHHPAGNAQGGAPSPAGLAPAE